MRTPEGDETVVAGGVTSLEKYQIHTRSRVRNEDYPNFFYLG